MRHLFLFFALSLASITWGNVELISFYFESGSTDLNGYSKEKMEGFQQLIKEWHIQIIEINAYSDMVASVEANLTISQQRADKLIAQLNISGPELIVNNYGKRKIVLNFTPFNWDRVDVYYHKGEAIHSEHLSEIIAVEEHIDAPEERLITVVGVPKLEEISVNVPIIIPIKFKGGGNTIEKGSQPRLEQLHATMVKFPELSVHIRGHVCCGNNQLISRKRAKVVYAYLKEHGIDKHRLSFKGYSNTEPLVFPEKSAADRSANRRVDVIFSKK